MDASLRGKGKEPSGGLVQQLFVGWLELSNGLLPCVGRGRREVRLAVFCVYGAVFADNERTRELPEQELA